MYEVTDLAVTPKQLISLWNGRPVQISATALKNPNSRVFVHPETFKRIQRSVKKGTGCRFCMSRDEILQTGPKGLTGSGRMAGMGFWSEAWNALKKAAKWVQDTAVPAAIDAAKWTKKNIIDSDLYQQKVRPKVEGKILDTLSGLPYADITTQGAQSAFDLTGIGMKPRAGIAATQQSKKKPSRKPCMK